MGYIPNVNYYVKIISTKVILEHNAHFKETTPAELL